MGPVDARRTVLPIHGKDRGILPEFAAARLIPYNTPLSAADGMLLLVGAASFLEGIAMEWDVSVYEFGLSMIAYRHAGTASTASSSRNTCAR